MTAIDSTTSMSLTTMNSTSTTLGSTAEASSTGATGVTGATGGTDQTVSSLTQTNSSSTFISNQVDSMLGSIDSSLVGNELLKMAITLLIMEILLGKDSEEDTGAMLLAALGAGPDSSASSSMMMSSETTTTQITLTSDSPAPMTGDSHNAPATDTTSTTGQTVNVMA